MNVLCFVIFVVFVYVHIQISSRILHEVVTHCRCSTAIDLFNKVMDQKMCKRFVFCCRFTYRFTSSANVHQFYRINNKTNKKQRQRNIQNIHEKKLYWLINWTFLLELCLLCFRCCFKNKKNRP